MMKITTFLLPVLWVNKVVYNVPSKALTYRQTRLYKRLRYGLTRTEENKVHKNTQKYSKPLKHLKSRNLEKSTLSNEFLNLESGLESTTFSWRNFQTFLTPSFMRETLCFLSSLYWWPLIQVHLLSSENLQLTSQQYRRLFYSTTLNQ